MSPPHHLAALAGPALRLQSDERLVKLIREGHGRAFDEIVRRYRGPLTGFAGSIVDSNRAEDVVQESLASAHTALLADERKISLKAWLYAIVRNRAFNDLRDNRRHRHEQIDPQHDGVAQPPDIAARRAEVATLVGGIQALPDAQREALVQREFSGLGHTEIAARMDLSASAVRQLIFRARTTLRNGMGALVPTPVLRYLMESATTRSGMAETGILGGGGALAFKAGVAVLATGAAVGGGIALKNHTRTGPDKARAAVERPAHKRARPNAPTTPTTASTASHGGQPSAADDHAPSHNANHQSGAASSAVSSGPASGAATSGSSPASSSSSGPAHGSSGNGGGTHETESGDDNSGSSGSGSSGEGEHGGGSGGGGSGGSGGGSGSSGSGDGGSSGSSGGSDDSGSSSGSGGSGEDGGSTGGSGSGSGSGSGEVGGDHGGSGSSHGGGDDGGVDAEG